MNDGKADAHSSRNPFFRRYGRRVSELETRFILFALFGMGGVALWAAFGLLKPFYFIRAGHDTGHDAEEERTCTGGSG